MRTAALTSSVWAALAPIFGAMRIESGALDRALEMGGMRGGLFLLQMRFGSRCGLALPRSASIALSAERWKPRPGDGISSNWLIAELTHRQAHGSNSQIPMEADRAPTPTSHWGLALWRRGVAERTYEVLASPPKDQSWGPDSIVLRLGPGVSLPARTGRTDDMRSWSHRPRLSPTRSSTRGTGHEGHRRLEAADISHNRRP